MHVYLAESIRMKLSDVRMIVRLLIHPIRTADAKGLQNLNPSILTTLKNEFGRKVTLV